MTTRLRRAAGALLATIVAGTGLFVATAPAKAATSCVFRMDSLTAENLLHDDGIDFVFLRFNNDFYPAGNDGVPFGEGDKFLPRPASVFGNPVQGVDSTGMRNWLVFDLWPTNYLIEGRKIVCSDQRREVVYDDGDARYRLRYRLTA
jgi:hypothetical protein